MRCRRVLVSYEAEATRPAVRYEPSMCAYGFSALPSPRVLGWQGQPSQGTRAAANAAVEAQVTAVVAATHLLRAGGDKETAVASRDAALAAIRSTMAALHPEVRSSHT